MNGLGKKLIWFFQKGYLLLGKSLLAFQKKVVCFLLEPLVVVENIFFGILEAHFTLQRSVFCVFVNTFLTLRGKFSESPRRFSTKSMKTFLRFYYNGMSKSRERTTVFIEKDQTCQDHESGSTQLEIAECIIPQMLGIRSKCERLEKFKLLSLWLYCNHLYTQLSRCR